MHGRLWVANSTTHRVQTALHMYIEMCDYVINARERLNGDSLTEVVRIYARYNLQALLSLVAHLLPDTAAVLLIFSSEYKAFLRPITRIKAGSQYDASVTRTLDPRSCVRIAAAPRTTHVTYSILIGSACNSHAIWRATV